MLWWVFPAVLAAAGCGGEEPGDDAVARSLSEARACGAMVVSEEWCAIRGVAAPMPLPIKMRAVGAGPAARARVGGARSAAAPSGVPEGTEVLRPLLATCQVPVAVTVSDHERVAHVHSRLAALAASRVA